MSAALGILSCFALCFPRPARAQEPEPPEAEAEEAEVAAEEAAQQTEPAVEIEPYGLLAASFFWLSRPMANADAPVAVLPGSSASLGATARQSRLGVRARSGPIRDALSASDAELVAEIDFLGGWYAENDVTYAMSHPRLRLFHARVAWDAVAVVVGQDWIVFAPRNPVSVAHVAVAGFQGAGNAWGRLPQAKIEVTAGHLTASAAVLAPVSTGPVSGGATPGLTVGRAPGGADRSETPSIQGCLAYRVPLDDRTLTAGISGHWAREEVTYGEPARTEDVRSWGAAIDLDLPLLPFLSLGGELLAGANLDGFFVDADVVEGRAVSVLGGWAQLSAHFDPVAIHLGAGVEDARPPRGQSLPAGAIDRNAAVYAAVLGRAGPITAGIELSHLWTDRAEAPSTARGTHVAIGLLAPF